MLRTILFCGQDTLMDKKINTSWSMFILVCAVIGLMPVGFLYLTWDDDALRSPSIILSLAVLSLLAFLAMGWARLRAAHRVEPIHVSELEKIRALLRGPRKLQIIWFSATILLVILAAVVTGLMGAMK